MPTLLKNNQVIDDSWVVVNDNSISEASALPDGDLLLPLTVWLRCSDAAGERNLALWLNSDDDVQLLDGHCHRLAVIAINFPTFADGRGYSMAALLRQQFGYQGELRAIGDVLRDQLFYLKRVGFDSFALRADQDPHQALASLNDFRHCYQASSDNPEPLFRRRA